MVTDLRQKILLGMLVIALGVVLYHAFGGQEPAPTAATNVGTSASSTPRRSPALAPAPDVRLQALETERPKPGTDGRNLFRFKQRAVSPPPGSAASMPTMPALPPAPVGPPPIALKFVGILEMPQHAARIAVLSDGRNVFHGREGQTIEGRYQILRIGTESIELAYIDGRGRQTIRLSGG